MSDQTPHDQTPHDQTPHEQVPYDQVPYDPNQHDPNQHDPNKPAQAAPEARTEAPVTPPPANHSARVAFCQDCGKPLTADTLRAVGTGVFCEPCLMNRVAAQNSVPGYASIPPAGYPASPLATPAHPVLAGFLGFIPGVGAMYNGQYAKGFAHLVIFVLLDSMSKNVSGVFGVFVAAWVCYQIFDAYHTAKARNEGLPLPNIFGLNDIGDKMGFGKTWGWHGAGARPASATPPPPSTSSWQTPHPPPGPIPSGPDWVGYVPPTNFASGGASRPEAYAATAAHQPTNPGAPPLASEMREPPPHAETFTGAANPYAVPTIPPEWATSSQGAEAEALPNRKHFPAGAFWLIGLGMLILLANLVPDWRMTERWWSPLLFAGLSILIFTRRLRSGAPLLASLRAPAVLMVLAIMFALHAADVYVNFGILFAVLFITVGLLLMLERTLGGTSGYPAAHPSRTSFVPEPEYPTTAYQNAAPTDHDAPKGGL